MRVEAAKLLRTGPIKQNTPTAAIRIPKNLRHDPLSVPNAIPSTRVETGMVVLIKVALMAVVKDKPLTKRNWFRTKPSALETISKGQSALAIGRRFRVKADRITSSTVAPATRKPTRATAGTVRKAILPTTGQVANRN